MKHARAVVISYALTFLAILAVLAGLAVLAPLPASADLVALSDEQMGDISAAGFSRFVVDGNTVRADFNIQAQTYTTIESLKMGYWDKGSGDGWDQHWEQVRFGSEDVDMSLSGLFIEATFDNIGDTANRKLLSVFFGFRQATGELAANFQSLSRLGVGVGRTNPGQTTFRLQNSELAFSFQLEGANKGIWVSFVDKPPTP